MDAIARTFNFLWLGICLYTWVGPGIFRNHVKKELDTVVLKDDF